MDKLIADLNERFSGVGTWAHGVWVGMKWVDWDAKTPHPYLDIQVELVPITPNTKNRKGYFKVANTVSNSALRPTSYGKKRKPRK